MPIYTVEHAILLTASQKDDLAAAITDIHALHFAAPRFFVNVVFTDVSEAITYSGGKRRSGSHIKAHVRSSKSRTQKDWVVVGGKIQEAWDEVVGKGLPRVRRGEAQPDTSLRSVILMADIVGGREAGLVLPEVGGEAEWYKENMEEFERRAGGGEEEFQEMVQEIKERNLLEPPKQLEENQMEEEESRPGMTAKERLEDALGWGDSA